MSRILFLDIDGVLNPIPLRTFPRLDRTLPQRLARQSGNSDYLRISTTALQLAHESWDKESLALLRSLCEDYDLQIVISSSWGIFYSLKELRLLFALHDLAERIIAITPYVGKRSENIWLCTGTSDDRGMDLAG
ncbi:MAG: HAD domain-containing protein [Merdibacter sp.]